MGNSSNRGKVNIILNAVGTMLVYSGHFGISAMSPSILAQYNGKKGVNEHLIFNGFALSSISTVVFCPFIAPTISKIGTKASLVLGGVLMGALNCSLYYPAALTFLVGTGLNGIGCALMRASSLKYLTDNSPTEKLARNLGLHWSIFMQCIFVGNLIMLLGVGNSTYISDGLRLRLCSSIVVITGVGVTSHLLLKPQEPSSDQETPILIKKEAELASSSESISSTGSNLGKSPGFKETFRSLLSWSTVNLIFIMFNCGIFPTTFATFAPIFIGQLLTRKAYVPLFGMFVGIGEMVGSLIAGRTISKLGIKTSALLIALLAYLSVAAVATIFPLHPTKQPIVSPTVASILTLGLILGVGDSTNGVLLSTIVGKVFQSNTELGFALYACMFNVSVTTIYLISSYNSFGTMVSIFVVIITGMLAAVLTLDKKSLSTSNS